MAGHEVADVVLGDPLGARPGGAEQARAGPAEAAVERPAECGVLGGALLGVEDAGLALHVVERQIGERTAYALEEVDHGLPRTGGVERRRVDLDPRVVVEVGLGHRRHDQVLDEVRDLGGSEGLVPGAHSED